VGAHSEDVDDHLERQPADLWGQTDHPDVTSNLLLLENQSDQDRGFEDLHPADPIPQLESSAQAARHPTIGAREDSSNGSLPTATTIEMFGTPPHEMADSEGNNYADNLQQACIRATDWVMPPETANGKLNTQGAGDEVPASQEDISHRQSSSGRTSQDSTESYHTHLKKQKTSSTHGSTKTMSSVKHWLRGLKRYETDLKLAGFDQQRPPEIHSGHSTPGALPMHISTFQPEDLAKILSSRSRSQEREHRKDKKHHRLSTTTGFSASHHSHKKHRNSFFSTFGSSHKHQHKQKDTPERRPSTPNHSHQEEEPFDQLSPRLHGRPRSPARGRTGYFPRPSEFDEASFVKGPRVSFSRRAGELDEPAACGSKPDLPIPPSPVQDGWLTQRRPRMMRYSSTPISPGDTSARAMDHPAANDEYKNYFDEDNSLSVHFDNPPQSNNRSQSNGAIQSNGHPHQFNDTPPHMFRPMQPSPVVPRNPGRVFVPPEAKRVTATFDTKTRGNKFAGYVLDSWYHNGVEREGMKKELNHSNEWHTPFPMPQEAMNGPELEEQDWYRIRKDLILSEEEPQDLDELRMFEWDLPEHLPGSPLCPLSPKNPSKGQGACIYHGRKRKDGAGISPQRTMAATDIGVDLWK
jgi:hypothetical protein